MVGKMDRLSKRGLGEIWLSKKHHLQLGLIGVQKHTGFDSARLDERIASLDQRFQINAH
jgi:hypothetical protein